MVRRALFAGPLLFTLLAACGSSDDSSGATGASGAAGSSGSAGGAGSGGSTPDPNPLSLPLGTDGPWGTGYKNWSVTYTPKTGTEPRTIKVHVWYPTKDVEGDSPHYLGAKNEVENAKLFVPPWPSGKLPVRIHSHGSQSFAAAGSAIHRHFASHGWITLAPDHTGNLLVQNLDPRPFAMYAWRSLDLTQALDAFGALPATDELSGKGDLSKVLLTGHSYGGFTAWASAGTTFDAKAIDAQCAKMPLPFAAPCTDQEKATFLAGLVDPRVVAAAPMAGGAGSTDWFGETGQNAVKVPIVQLTGSSDTGPATESKAMMDRVSGIDVTWVDVKGGCHELFSLGGCKDVPSDVGFPIIDTYLLALGRKHVLGDTDEKVADVLSGKAMVSSLVSFQRKTP